MATLTKFNQFVADLAEKVHDLGSDQLKIMLTDIAPLLTNAVRADITEIAPGNGYNAGGIALTTTSAAQSGGIFRLKVNNVTLIAVGGPIAQFRYMVLYNSTPGAGNLIGLYDFGSEVNIPINLSFSINADQISGILTVQ